MLTHPRWIVPLDPGEATEMSPALIVLVMDDLQIRILQRDRAHEALPLLASLAACQLGQALQDASAYVGQARAKAAAKRKR